MSTISNTPAAPISAPQAPAANPSINAEDLQALLQIIDLASQRGAFKAPELGQIGQVFDRVASFLKMIAEQQQKNTPAAVNPEQPNMPISTNLAMPPVTPTPINVPAQNLPPQHASGPVPAFLNKGSQ